MNNESISRSEFESRRRGRVRIAACVAAAAVTLATAGCGGSNVRAADTDAGGGPQVTVGVVTIGTKPLARQLTTSSELVPFQEIDVYAKEAGYVRKLNVDYGSRVKVGDVLAVLEIPELEAQLQQDDAAVKNAQDRVMTAQHELSRTEAQHKVAHLQYERLTGVAKTKAGLVAQQEVDDSQGKDLALESAVEAAHSSLDGAQSALQVAQASRDRDRALYSYSKITAPFAGVVTQRYANLGTLLQAGTSSSTQAMPLVKLSQDSLFRLVIPVPESYVRYIHVGDPVDVHVPSLDRTFPGKITRFSVDVREDTRTMHTEVDVPNADRALIPGMYAEATLSLDRKDRAIAVPLQAVNHQADRTTVYTVGGDGKIVDRPVTLGIQTATDAEALSGLSVGDRVVVSDRGGLKPGQAVRTQTVELVKADTGEDSK
jgi:RND family efflux transporter MFP subunit